MHIFCSFWLFHVFKLFFSTYLSPQICIYFLLNYASHSSMWVMGHLKNSFAQNCHLFHAIYVCKQVWTYTTWSCTFFLHIERSVRPSTKICVRVTSSSFSNTNWLSLNVLLARYRSGHNHSVARVCQSARLFVLRSKSCIGFTRLKCENARVFLLVRKCCALKSHFLFVLCWLINCQIVFWGGFLMCSCIVVLAGEVSILASTDGS